MRKGSVEVTIPNVPDPLILSRSTLAALLQIAARVGAEQIGDEEMSNVSFSKVIAGILTGDKVLQMSGAGVILKSFNFQKDERHFTAGTLWGNDKTLTASAGNFTAADIGREVQGVGLAPGTTIASVTSATEVELSAFPGTGVWPDVAIYMPGRPAGAGWALYGDGKMEINAGGIFRGKLELAGFTATADGAVTIGVGDSKMTANPDGSFTWGKGGAIVGITPDGEFFAGGIDYASAIVRIAANGDLTVRNTTQSLHSISIGAIDPTILTPTASPPGGAFDGSVNVALLCQTQGVKIYYTLDGSTPTAASTLYTGALISLSATTTIKAIAVKMGEVSGVMSTTFTNAAGTAPNTIFDPVGGDYSPTGGILEVLLTNSLAGSSIRYTTDGTTTPSEAVGTLISPSGGGAVPAAVIELAAGTRVVKAISFKSGTHTNSAVVTETYVITSGGGGTGGGGGGDGGGGRGSWYPP